jgi:NADPH-dependent 2,4-dienoyl-CoA reductase/sulfur reductase-like enzyme
VLRAGDHRGRPAGAGPAIRAGKRGEITSAEDVYAIGDAARWRDSRTGALVRSQHWESAVRQGAYVARSLLGADTPYHDVPYIWTDQHGARLQIAGAADGDEVYFADGGPENETYLALVRTGPRLAGVIALGRGRKFNRLRRTLATSPAWESVVTGVPGS